MLKLKDNPNLIEEYGKLHATDAAWPEITSITKKVGIPDMEIHIYDTTLFMIMDTKAYFNHEQAKEKPAKMETA